MLKDKPVLITLIDICIALVLIAFGMLFMSATLLYVGAGFLFAAFVLSILINKRII